MASLPYCVFPFLSDPNVLREFIALVKQYCHVGILENDDLWTLASSVKGREAEPMYGE
jgi:hypothetical protein